MKRNTSIILVSICLIVILAVSAITGCSPAAAPSTPSSPSTPAEPGTKTLQIGELFGITGWFSTREIPDMNETQIMADMINEQGGIKIGSDTYMIELLNEDTKSTMDGVTAAANRLVFEKDIKFIIGPTAFFSAAASPVCDPNKVMRVLSWCDGTPGQMDASTPYSFLGTPSSQGCAAVTAKYLHEAYPNVKKVAVVSPDDGNFPHLKRMFDPLIAEVGIEMVGDPVLYPNEMQDFSPIAQKVNAMKDSIDAVYHVNGVGPHTGNIAKGLRELGFTKPYACSLPSPLTEVITIAGLEASKDVFTISYTATDTSFPPLVKELVDRTVAEYGQDYSLYFTGADSLWALKEVIQAAQSLDPTEVKEQWESMDTIETLWGPGTVCGDETFGIAHHYVVHPLSVQILKDGKVTSGGTLEYYMP